MTIIYTEAVQSRRRGNDGEETSKGTIHAKGFDIGIYTTDLENEYISLTDIARYKSDAPHDVKNWLRSRETIEFLGLWESLHNPGFKQVEFDLFRSQAGFNMSPTSCCQWYLVFRWYIFRNQGLLQKPNRGGLQSWGTGACQMEEFFI